MRFSTFALAIAVLGGSELQAEDRAPRGSAALSYLTLTNRDEDQTYRSGASLSLAYRAAGPLALVGEVARSGRSSDFRATDGGLFQMRYESVRGGLQLGRSAGRVRPYGQLLAGPIRWRIRERFDPLGREGLAWESATHFSLAPGVGLDVSLADWLSVRGGAELAILFRRDRFEEAYKEELSSFRLGLAFHWGG